MMRARCRSPRAHAGDRPTRQAASTAWAFKPRSRPWAALSLALGPGGHRHPRRSRRSWPRSRTSSSLTEAATRGLPGAHEHAASPPVPPGVAPTPSTLTAYRWELRKLISQKRTYLGLGLAVILPLIFVLVQHLHNHHGHEQGNIFVSHITESGLATPVLMLLLLSVFMLPVIAALVAGDIVAAEDGNGTLKTILTRSVDRGQVFAAKALAAMTYAAIAVFLSAAVAIIAGVASWGFHHVVTFSGTVVSAPEGLLLVFAANAVYLIPLLSVTAFGVLLSTTTRNSAAAVVGTVGFTILLFIVGADPGPGGHQAIPAHRTVRELARPTAHPDRLGADLAFGVGLRAIRSPLAVRGLSRLPATGRSRRLSRSDSGTAICGERQSSRQRRAAERPTH